MNAEFDSVELSTTGPDMGAYDQLMQLDDDLVSPSARPEGDSAGTAYDEVLDGN